MEDARRGLRGAQFASRTYRMSHEKDASAVSLPFAQRSAELQLPH